MDELHRAADKFETEVERFSGQMSRLLDPDRPNPPTPEAVALAAAQAKRVRRATNLLVQRLAAFRDQLQP